VLAADYRSDEHYHQARQPEAEAIYSPLVKTSYLSGGGSPMVIIRLRHRRIEIRKNPARRAMDLPARIDTGQGSYLLCILDNFSESGVRITLASDAKLPREFSLVLTASGDVRRRCRTLWRDGVELGVQWLSDRAEV
jgi:hypothetical protein